ncbi:pRL2-8 [Streptomyces sp. NPDC058665]|uniref:pRL2-8 n=1 Tax=Streptomyces sp. NPDC058665 TaxID=3346586 RepID=UPI00365D42D3
MARDRANNPPRGQCQQCWRHAYDRSVHKGLGPRQDCKPCVDHMVNGHGNMIVR